MDKRIKLILRSQIDYLITEEFHRSMRVKVDKTTKVTTYITLVYCFVPYLIPVVLELR